jgi:hypothetical protein
MKEKRSTSYKIRLKDSELLRWKAAAKDANLPLSVYRTHLRSQEEAASRLSISRTKQRLILVVA